MSVFGFTSRKFKWLMELLAIPLGFQKTKAKWLVISQTRRPQKNRRAACIKYASKVFRGQRRMATPFGFYRQKNAPEPKGEVQGLEGLNRG